MDTHSPEPPASRPTDIPGLRSGLFNLVKDPGTANESGVRRGFPVLNGDSTDGLGPTLDCHRASVTRPGAPAAASGSGRVLITSAGPFVLESTDHSGNVRCVYGSRGTTT